MERAAPVAEDAVRDELGEEEGIAGASERAVEQRPPAARHHPDLATVLGLDVARGLLPGDRLGLVDGAAAALDEPKGEPEVVADARVVPAEVVRSPHCVDRPVSGGDRADRGLALPLPQLVAPVEPFLARAVCRLEAKLSAHVADVGVGEAAHERAQRVGLPAASSHRRRRPPRSPSGRLRCSELLPCPRARTRGARPSPSARRAPPTISFVRSVDPSEATTIRRRSAGYSSARRFSTLCSITSSSSCAATMTDTSGSHVLLSDRPRSKAGEARPPPADSRRASTPERRGFPRTGP